MVCPQSKSASSPRLQEVGKPQEVLKPKEESRPQESLKALEWKKPQGVEGHKRVKYIVRDVRVSIRGSWVFRNTCLCAKWNIDTRRLLCKLRKQGRVVQPHFPACVLYP
eukprot:scaffold3207_cov21-Tisochrysis_lutea.AAC.1